MYTDIVSELQDMENLLSCPICYELMNTAMIIPQCSHNFCSLCIRRHISYKTQCPTCNQPVTVPELRNNRLVDELIHLYRSVKGKRHQNTSNQEKLSEQVNCAGVSSTSTRTDTLVSNNDRRISGSTEVSKTVDRQTGADPDSSSDVDMSLSVVNTPTKSSLTSLKIASPLSSYFASKPGTSTNSSNTCRSDSGQDESSPGRRHSDLVKVSCPICGVLIPEKNVNLHLDRCLIRSEKEETMRTCTVKRKPLPKYVYSLMKDKELRKKMAELGLPTDGDRQTLIKRHQELLLRYNAQCDSLNPKSVKEVVKEVMDAEKKKSQLSARSPRTPKLKISKGATQQEIEEKQKKYVKRHKSQFAKLISETKQRMKEAKKSEERQTVSMASGTKACTEAGECERVLISQAKIQLENEASANEIFKYTAFGSSSCNSDGQVMKQVDNIPITSVSTDVMKSLQISSGKQLNTSALPSADGDVLQCPSEVTVIMPDGNIADLQDIKHNSKQMTKLRKKSNNVGEHYPGLGGISPSLRDARHVKSSCNGYVESVKPVYHETASVSSGVVTPNKRDACLGSEVYPESPSLYSESASPTNLGSSANCLEFAQRLTHATNPNSESTDAGVKKVCRVLDCENNFLVSDNSTDSLKLGGFDSQLPSTQPGSKHEKENIGDRKYHQDQPGMECFVGCSPADLTLSPDSPVLQESSNSKKRKFYNEQKSEQLEHHNMKRKATRSKARKAESVCKEPTRRSTRQSRKPRNLD